MRLPDKKGYFGEFGGKYVPETLMFALRQLEDAYLSVRNDKKFREELNYYLRDYAGRPTPLYHARNLGRSLGLSSVFLKREDLLHTGAHKINNTLGQILLARRMGKRRIIAETGAGQHGVATATVAALFGMECTVYMGSEDIQRQKLNVFRMQLLGTRVCPVESGSCTLKDAINEAFRDWVTNVSSTHYILGSVVGPHPYPVMVRDFQSVIGREAKRQMMALKGRLPDYVLACVGAGSNSIGIFHEFVPHRSVKLIGVEAAGYGLSSGKHSATLSKGSEGVLHGARSLVLENSDGQINQAHSVAAGLDYPGVGPEHAFLKTSARATYASVTDKQALTAFSELCRLEGIIPALESAHAVAYLKQLSSKVKKDALIIVCLSGRGDKDIHTVLEANKHNE